VGVELTVLGCSGSYGSHAMGACSGYLLRDGDTAIWMDCGNGSFVNLQRHIAPEDLSAVVLTHEHPDHCVDIYGLHVLLRYGLELTGMPLFAPAGAEEHLGALVSGFGDVFVWNDLSDGLGASIGTIDLQFARTDHPPPTFAVEARTNGSRMIYTSDTGPKWSIEAFDSGADFVLSEASYLHADRLSPIHLSAYEAASAARASGADRLMLTHLWPRVDRAASAAEGSEAFGGAVALAAPHVQVVI
jgi:ribonuclease BN (tRNA processing enzyme)